MRPVLMFAVSSLLCACASSWAEGWVKPGAGPDDLEHARRECLQDAAIGKGSGQFGYDSPDQRLFAACMQNRGWQRDASR